MALSGQLSLVARRTGGNFSNIFRGKSMRSLNRSASKILMLMACTAISSPAFAQTTDDSYQDQYSIVDQNNVNRINGHVQWTSHDISIGNVNSSDKGNINNTFQHLKSDVNLMDSAGLELITYGSIHGTSKWPVVYSQGTNFSSSRWRRKLRGIAPSASCLRYLVAIVWSFSTSV